MDVLSNNNVNEDHSMSSKKTGDFDIDEYTALTRDCLETLDDDSFPTPRVDSGAESAQRPTRENVFLKNPVVIGLIVLLCCNVLVLGFYSSKESTVLSQHEATEQLQSTFLSDYKLIESTERFLAAGDMANSPKEKTFLGELEQFNKTLGTDPEEAGFKTDDFHFLQDGFVYIDKDK